MKLVAYKLSLIGAGDRNSIKCDKIDVAIDGAQRRYLERLDGI